MRDCSTSRESIERGTNGWRATARVGRGGELERAKLRICKCGAHNNGALLYADAVGCVALGRRDNVQCASNATRYADSDEFHFQTALSTRFGLTFENNAKITLCKRREILSLCGPNYFANER